MSRSDLAAAALGIGFVAAGLNHFRRPDAYEAIVPRWVPRPDVAHTAAGIGEIALGAAMLHPASRPLAARGLVWLLLIVLPANIDMAIHRVGWGRGSEGRLERREGRGNPVLLWLRLPLQFVLIALLRRHTRTVRSAPGP